MDQLSEKEVPYQQFLNGFSAQPPALLGDPVNGLLIAWTDALEPGQLLIASNEDVPPFEPRVVNPDWKTFQTPALAEVDEWGALFLAWSDPEGAIYLGSAAKDWSTKVAIAPPGSTQSGPALAFGNDRLFLAWSHTGLPYVATIDRKMQVSITWTDAFILSSRPSLTWNKGELYLLTGGAADEQDATMRIAVSTDNGQTFEQIERLQATTCLGPPSLVIVEDTYYLAWAESDSPYNLTIASTKTLTSYTPVRYAAPCHEGAPALVGSLNGLAVGWTYGAVPTDPRSHQIALGYPALL